VWLNQSSMANSRSPAPFQGPSQSTSSALPRSFAVSACPAVTGSSRLLSVRLAPSITQPIGMPKRSVAIDHFPQRVHRTAPVARWASVGRR